MSYTKQATSDLVSVPASGLPVTPTTAPAIGLHAIITFVVVAVNCLLWTEAPVFDFSLRVGVFVLNPERS
jgi:hypothetical protein